METAVLVTEMGKTMETSESEHASEALIWEVEGRKPGVASSLGINIPLLKIHLTITVTILTRQSQIKTLGHWSTYLSKVGGEVVVETVQIQTEMNLYR